MAVELQNRPGDIPIIVQKYGGTSVADIDKIKAVAAKVVQTARQGNAVVVVVSAMGDSTDELIELAGKITNTPPQRELDMLVTVGERISMALLSMAIGDLGEEAISFTGSQSGIITNARQGAARIIEVRPYRVQDELAQGRIVIVAGYQGVSYRKEVTTLGRGGSDTTAVALAAALGASACEIYSDVEGVYSADPRVVVDADRLTEVSYEEMQELARFGAKVLNADAVEFARRAGIGLFAKASNGTGPGTKITRPDGFPDNLLAEERNLYVTGVAGRKDVLLVEYTCPASGDDRSRQVLSALSDCDMLFCSTRSGRDQTVALITTENLHDVDGLCRELREMFSDTIGIRRGLGLVSLVGSTVGNRIDAQARLLDELIQAGINHKFTFTSRSTVSVCLRAENVDRTVQLLHSIFCSK